MFDLSLRVLQGRWRTFFAVTGLVLVLPTAVVLTLGWITDTLVWVLAVAALLTPLMRVPFTLLGARLLFRDEVVAADLGEALRGAAGAALALLVVSWVTLGVGVGSLLLLWIPTQVAVFFLPETLLLERVGVARGVRRSLVLATEQLGPVLVGVMMVVGLLGWGMAVAEATGQAMMGTVLQLGAPFGSVLEGDVTPWVILGLVLVQPLVALFRLLLYVDVRTRLEGWDLQVGLKAAGEDA